MLSVCPSVAISFCHAGVARGYTPEYLVRWSSGSRELIEVKYRSDLREQWHRLRSAFSAARAWYSANESQFRIATGRSIRGVRLTNIKRLLPLRTAYLDAATAAEIVGLLTTSSSATLASVIAALPGDRANTLGAIWRSHAVC